jgi:ornithine carbamoyltransferase
MLENMKDFLSVQDFSPETLQKLIDLAIKMKANKKRFSKSLAGKKLGMIFEKSSTRTRVSFEMGIYELGGVGLFLSSRDIQMGRGEPIRDTAKVLSRYIDGIMIRTFAQADVEEFAREADIPVINGLTDLLHPCQTLADFQTIYEYKKRIEGVKVASSATQQRQLIPGDACHQSSARISPSRIEWLRHGTRAIAELMRVTRKFPGVRNHHETTCEA